MSISINIPELISIAKSIRPLFCDRTEASRVHVKGYSDYVTEVDFAVQELVKQKLLASYPEIQFMGEEKDNSEIDFAKPAWILDPVDGTTNLVHDFRASALSLALWNGKEVELGIVYQPFTEELFFARKGKGAFLNDKPIHVSGAKSMENSLISIGTSPYYRDMTEENFAIFKKVYESCADIRRIGSAAIDLAYVACGRTDAYFEKYLKPWDFAAGLLLVQEAGGQISDLSGNPLNAAQTSDVVAGTPVIHKELIERIFN